MSVSRFPGLERACWNLLRDVGRNGYATPESYTSGPGAGVRAGASDPRWAWLTGEGLLRILPVPVWGNRVLTAVQLTGAGRRLLQSRGLPAAPGELELLCDRLGRALKDRYGQALLLARLARVLGYAVQHLPELPARPVTADLCLVRGRERMFVMLMPGIDHMPPDMDVWHAVAQAQPFLPVAAPDAETLKRVLDAAQDRICMLRGAVLPELEARVHSGSRTLWRCSRSRFRTAAALRPPRPRQAALRAALLSQGLLRSRYSTAGGKFGNGVEKGGVRSREQTPDPQLF